MAFVYDPNLDPNDPRNQPGNQPQLPSAGSTTSQGAQSASQPQMGQPTSSGQFQNLDSYLQAQQGNQFGQQVANKLQGEVDQANQARQNAEQTFKGQSDQNTVNYNPDVVNQTLQNPTQVLSQKDQTFSSPSTYDQFVKERDAQYKGPLSLSDTPALYNQVFGTAQGAAQKANATGSEEGRFGLLTNYFNNPNYTQGQKSLDNLLLQGNDQTQQSFDTIRQNAQAAQQAAQNSAQNLQNYAATNKGTTEATAQKVKDTVNPEITNELGQYQNTLQQALNNQGAGYNQELAALKNTDPGQYQSIISKYGAAPDLNYQLPKGYNEVQGANDSGYWGINNSQGLSSFYNRNQIPTLSSVTSADQQSKLNALQQLMNQAPTPFDVSQAGTYNANLPGTFDVQGFNQALSDAKNAYLQREAPIINDINAITTAPFDIGHPGNPQQQLNDAVKAKLDQLNKIREGFGLGDLAMPVVNPPGTRPPGIPVPPPRAPIEL